MCFRYFTTCYFLISRSCRISAAPHWGWAFLMWAFHQRTVLYDLLRPFKGQKSGKVIGIRPFLDLLLTPYWFHFDRFFISFVVNIENSAICDLSPTDIVVASTLSQHFIDFSFAVKSFLFSTFSRFWVFSPSLWNMSFGSCKSKLAQGLFLKFFEAYPKTGSSGR